MIGILGVPPKMPGNARELEQWLRTLNRHVKYDGTRAVLDALTALSSRTGTDIATILTYLSDAGRATDQRLLPMVNFGNVSSVQSVEPLSATAGAATADIAIAAHTLHTDFGSIAYNSGAILGLPLNTTHYVYADDPDYAGGAVSYLATTAKPTIPSNSGRYFVGVITTPVAANTANVADAASASPIVFRTSAAHGWSSGNTVSFAGLPGDFGTNLNGNSYVITVVDADEFSIAVNGAGYAAYTTGGAVTRIVADTVPDYGGGGGGWLYF